MASANSILIIGWNESTRELINTLLSKSDNNQLFLLDQTLLQSPLNHNRLKIIKGNPLDKNDLMHANVNNVECIVISSNTNKTEAEADMESIITLLTIKGLNPKAHCIIEIRTREQMINAEKAGADEVIFSSDITSIEVIKCLSHNSINFLELLSMNHSIINCFPISREYTDSTFSEFSTIKMSENNRCIPIGVLSKKGNIHTNTNRVIKTGDYLIQIEQID
jgi:voltage-gated potassium channel